LEDHRLIRGEKNVVVHRRSRRFSNGRRAALAAARDSIIALSR